MMWTCEFCDKEEIVHRTTNDELFVLHHCPCFGGAIAPGAGKNIRRYVARLKQFFSKPPVEIVVFPLREASV